MSTGKLKTKAFTLSEMLVVLLLTTVIVGLSFSVLRLVESQMGGMDAELSKISEINRLRLALWTDLNSCDRAFISSGPTRLVLNTPIKNSSYQLLENLIVRGRDSFYIGNYETQFFFENRVVTNGEVDAIHLNYKLETQNPSFAKASEGMPKHKTRNTKLFVFKTNSATTYMNN